MQTKLERLCCGAHQKIEHDLILQGAAAYRHTPCAGSGKRQMLALRGPSKIRMTKPAIHSNGPGMLIKTQLTAHVPSRDVKSPYGRTHASEICVLYVINSHMMPPGCLLPCMIRESKLPSCKREACVQEEAPQTWPQHALNRKTRQIQKNPEILEYNHISRLFLLDPEIRRQKV